MNKVFFTILILFLSDKVYGQKFVGNYYNFFGDILELQADSTFRYILRFDLTSRSGNWNVQHDTIYLEVMLQDTLNNDVSIDFAKRDSVGFVADSVSPVYYSIFVHSDRRRNRQEIPDKFYYRKEKLYTIDQSGSLIKKKQADSLSRKKFPPYFMKIDE